MATVETQPRQSTRPRRHHFTSFVKRLASLKTYSSDSAPKKTASTRNFPYPLSGIPRRVSQHDPDHESPRRSEVSSAESPVGSKSSLPDSQDGLTTGKKSMAPTVDTTPDTTDAKSKAGTATTGAGGRSSRRFGGEGSTFSSPAPSVRSVTTTLTTIQSGHPNVAVGTNTPAAVQFTHQFPTASTPASALPSHMVQQAGHPPTYSTATANNLLTDNASILTLASSSKRRRRNSLDTNASVRALAPSSLFGGSRESLPLSVLSGPVPDTSTPGTGLTALPSRPSISGYPSEQRTSVYSSSGIQLAGTSTRDANTLQSERNSYYANPKANTGDGGSVRSGRFSHGRNDSVGGSVAGVSIGSPLTTPLERVADAPGKHEEKD